jgi:hypothetical protein
MVVTRVSRPQNANLVRAMSAAVKPTTAVCQHSTHAVGPQHRRHERGDACGRVME